MVLENENDIFLPYIIHWLHGSDVILLTMT